VIRYRGSVDRIFLGLVVIMLCLGTVMIASASYANSLEYNEDSYFFIKKQIMMASLGLAAMIAMVYFADYIRLEKLTICFFVVTVAVNILTAFFGTLKNGARRWFDIPVINVSVQPSELLKLAVIMIFAYCVSKKTEEMKKMKWGAGISLLITVFGVIPMLLQKHISGLIIVAALCAAMMVIGEAPALFLGIGGAAGMLCIAALYNYTEAIVEFLSKSSFAHVGKRLAVWKDPYIDPLGDGHQIIQSLYAIGSGGWTGVGIGQSKQKFLYLPEPQNDYIFAIICEELGYIGAILIIAAFCMLVWRGVWIAYKAPDKFSSFLVMGITIKVALQAALNIAVVTNIFPATGITMPFFSYGGTALIILMAEMGIILSVSKYSYKKS
jgi:cell division protein FtsW